MKTSKTNLVLIGLLFICSVFSCSTTKPFHGLKEDVYNSIKTESVGGKLDFEKTLQSNQLYVYDGIAYNYHEASLYLWGSAVRLLGISKSSEAISLYEEIKTVKLEPYLAKALKAGFNRKSTPSTK